MDPVSRILELVKTALDEFGRGDILLSTSIRMAIRIARLRNDYTNLCWLEQEMVDFRDMQARIRIVGEIKPHFSSTEWEELRTSIGNAYLGERKMKEVDYEGNFLDKGNGCVLAIPEIEAQAKTWSRDAETAVPPQGLPLVDLNFSVQPHNQLRAMYQGMAAQYRDILTRVGHRVFVFLSAAERELIYGQVNADIFDRNRRYVDSRLRSVAPDAAEQFSAAYRRLGEGGSEAKSQALLSCRRILKSVADHVYPPRKQPIMDHDGKIREVTDSHFVNRLWQFVSDAVGGRVSGDLLLSQINDLGNRIDGIYDLATKGVHADVSEFELNQCVIQTWFLVGDILRLEERDSAIYADENEENDSHTV